jgi:hypothetical protein
MIENQIGRLRLVKRGKFKSAITRQIFDQHIKPIMRSLGIECSLYQTYSSQNETEHVEINNDRFLVMDQALLELLNTIDAAGRLPTESSIITDSLLRPMAEAFRDAGQLMLYGVFVCRALEAKSRVKKLTVYGKGTHEEVWQNLVVMLHEAGHGLNPDHELALALRNEVILTASGDLTKRAAYTNDALRTLLEHGSESIPASPLTDPLLSKHVEDPLFCQEEIDQTTRRLMRRGEYFDELLCDSFSLAFLEKYFLSEEEIKITNHDAEFVLSTAYKAFLGLRGVHYIKSSVSSSFRARGPAEANRDLAVFASLRANRTARRIIEIASIRFDKSKVGRIEAEFGRAMAVHTKRICESTDSLIGEAKKIRSNKKAAERVLAEKEIDIKTIRKDPLNAVLKLDELWQQLVA